MKNTKWVSDELDSIVRAREKPSLFWLLGGCQVGTMGRCSPAVGLGLLGEKTCQHCLGRTVFGL